AGGHQPQPGDHRGQAGGRQSQRHDHRCPAGRADVQQVDAPRGQQARARSPRSFAVARTGFEPRQPAGPRRCARSREAARLQARKIQMRLLTRTIASIGLAAALGACSLGGLLGGGAKGPVTLETLNPEAADPGPIARTASAGQAVTIEVPIVPEQLRATRVPVQISPTDVQYVTNLQWVDTPARLFQNLLEETVRRTTNRVVLDPAQSGLDPGIVLHGQLERFGYDAQTGQAVVVYDGSLATAGNQVQTRRFTATAPADGTGASVGPALNRAANQVAREVAQWIGGQSPFSAHSGH